MQNNFMFPTCKKSQKLVKKEEHSSFDGLIQEDIDLSDIYLAVPKIEICFNRAKMTPTTLGYPVISPNWTFCGPGHQSRSL